MFQTTNQITLYLHVFAIHNYGPTNSCKWAYNEIYIYIYI